MAAVKEVQETTAVRLGALLDAGDGATVTLVAGETRLVAHRAVLVSRSPVFQAMFQYDTLEASSGQVIITDVEGEVMRELLDYMYTLQAPQLSAMTPQMLAAADKYGLLALKTVCEQQVSAQLTIDNAAAAAVLAVRHSCPGLTAAAIAFIKAHNCQVMATQGWADAMQNHLEDVIEVTRLLADPPAETTAPISTGGRSTPGTHHQPHSDHGWTLASAAPAIAAHNTDPFFHIIVALLRRLPIQDRLDMLTWAVMYGRVEDLRALAAAGVVEEQIRGLVLGQTALHTAASGGHVEAVRSLLDARAPVDFQDVDYQTPLHLAARNGHTAVVQLLLTSADCNATKSGVDTPLHLAVREGHADVAAVLLQAGADRGARNEAGSTPLDLARQANNQQLIDMLT
ncbi:ankyrin-1-like isoform X1 [Schistocerca americana]|uniref:ankyrin-1-like isoform X1 n=1 Tax=Schistocerca americana TaxID=7009 RepID=UPI001F500CF7|nr:ankyrin-1-like isoform X1 [Schistocerca americana]